MILTLAFFSVFNCLAGYVFRCNIPGENGKTVRMQFNTLNDSQCEVYNSYPSSAFDYYGDASISKSTVGAIHIPDSVSYNNRFYKVVGIQNGSFYGCSKLSAVYIPETVGYIGDQVFAYCSELQTVSLPESVTKIGKEAFYKCSQLESIYIPKSVEFIGVDAFNYCSALNGVYITDIASWCNISFAISVYDGKLFQIHYTMLIICI